MVSLGQFKALFNEKPKKQFLSNDAAVKSTPTKNLIKDHSALSLNIGRYSALWY